MALRTAHGARADSALRVETLPADELPDPLPVNLAGVPGPLARRDDGTIAGSAAAKALGARGGAAKATKRKLLQGIGLAKLSEENDFHPYWRATSEWCDAVNAEYALACGGVMGPAAMSIVGSAAGLLAASRFFSDRAMEDPSIKGKAEMFITASKFHDRHRQALLTAYELANRLGQARGQSPIDPYAMLAKLAEIEPPAYDAPDPNS